LFLDGERDGITRNAPGWFFTYSSKFVTLQVLFGRALAPDLVAMTTAFAPRGPTGGFHLDQSSRVEISLPARDANLIEMNFAQ